MVALVSLDDLRIIKQQEERQGLTAVAGQWQGFSEIQEVLGDIASLRQQGGGGRDVSL
jgi:hypothetical protein